MSEPLKPCPGADAGKFTVSTVRIKLGPHAYSGQWTTFCNGCGWSSGYHGTREEAEEHWNRRAPAALPTREEIADVITDGRWDEATSEHIADAILSLLRAREAEG